MLIVKEDKTRPLSEGQIFVELTKNRDISVTNCDRLGYWCDKAHLKHFILEISKVMTNKELMDLLGERFAKNYGETKGISSKRQEVLEYFAARDENDSLWVYREKPIKKENRWASVPIGKFNHSLFPSIGWEDEKPTEIRIIIEKK